MGKLIVGGAVKEAEVRAVVTKADGTVEDLGVVASWKKPSLVERIYGYFRNR